MQRRRQRRAVADEAATNAASDEVVSPEEHPYIAGMFEGRAPNEFTVGNGVEYGAFTNRVLTAGKKYKAFVRVKVKVCLELYLAIKTFRQKVCKYCNH